MTNQPTGDFDPAKDIFAHLRTLSGGGVYQRMRHQELQQRYNITNHDDTGFTFPFLNKETTEKYARDQLNQYPTQT